MDPSKKARAVALEELRQRHIDDIETIYQSQLKIVTRDDAEDKDKINAAKVLAQLLGVGRVGSEKPPSPPPTKPTPEQQVAPLSDERINDILAKLGAK